MFHVRLYIMVAFLIFFSPLYSMDFFKLFTTQKKENPKKQEITGPNLLQLLPEEIQNHIAGYLTFPDKETDEEFEERTKNLEQGDSRRCASINNQNYKLALEASGLITLTQKLVFYDLRKRSKEAIYKYHADPSARDVLLFSLTPNGKVIITDQYKDKLIDPLHNTAIVYKKTQHPDFFINNCSDNRYWAIATSLDKKLAAKVFTHFDRDNKTYKHTLEIYECDATTMTQIKKIPLDFPFSIIKSVAFNEQSTQVIVHALITHCTDEFIKQIKTGIVFSDVISRIIPLVDPKEHAQKSIKRLYDYCEKRGICTRKQLIAPNN